VNRILKATLWFAAFEPTFWSGITTLSQVLKYALAGLRYTSNKNIVISVVLTLIGIYCLYGFLSNLMKEIKDKGEEE